MIVIYDHSTFQKQTQRALHPLRGPVPSRTRTFKGHPQRLPLFRSLRRGLQTTVLLLVGVLSSLFSKLIQFPQKVLESFALRNYLTQRKSSLVRITIWHLVLTLTSEVSHYHTVSQQRSAGNWRHSRISNRWTTAGWFTEQVSDESIKSTWDQTHVDLSFVRRSDTDYLEFYFRPRNN